MLVTILGFSYHHHPSSFMSPMMLETKLVKMERVVQLLERIVKVRPDALDIIIRWHPEPSFSYWYRGAWTVPDNREEQQETLIEVFLEQFCGLRYGSDPPRPRPIQRDNVLVNQWVLRFFEILLNKDPAKAQLAQEYLRTNQFPENEDNRQFFVRALFEWGFMDQAKSKIVRRMFRSNPAANTQVQVQEHGFRRAHQTNVLENLAPSISQYLDRRDYHNTVKALYPPSPKNTGGKRAKAKGKTKRRRNTIRRIRARK